MSDQNLCEWKNYQQLIKRFKEANINGDVQLMKKLKEEIHELCILCGAIPNKDLMRILEDNTVNVRDAMTFIERCINNGNVKPAETILNEINRIAGCDSGKCNCQHTEKMLTVIGFQTYEIHPDGTLSPYEEPPEVERSLPNPNIEEDRRKLTYPPICIETCEFIRHCGAYPRNLGNICVNRFDLMRGK